MPRAVRVEFKGAFYHVMCRGDRRESIFLGEADRDLFLETLGQTCVRAGLLVHAFALMSNHYHLLVETPGGNLVAGMRWLQTTYTARFNARHRLDGHLFQGRYKALVIDPDAPEYARTVADYIHLNPVRAGLALTEEALAKWPWSSYRAYAMGEEMPEWLEPSAIYGESGLNHAKAADRRRWRRTMAGRIAEEAAGREEGAEPTSDSRWAELRRGWILGTEGFREKIEKLIGDERRVKKRRRESYDGAGFGRSDREGAEHLLKAGLERLGLALIEVRAMRKNDERKQSLAWLLKRHTTMGNEWICERLGMGDRSNLNRAARRFELEKERKIMLLKATLHQCPD